MKNTSNQKSKNYLHGFIKFIFALVVLTGAAHANTYTVMNTNDGGFGSLRQAIFDVHNSSDLQDTIVFSIPGSGVRTINLQSPLPVFRYKDGTDRNCGYGKPLTIDATTMSGYAGVPRVELNGASAGAGANGLTIAWGIVTVKGLAINRFAQWGIYLKQEPDNNSLCNDFPEPEAALHLVGSRIGTDATGSQDLGNGAGGVHIKTYQASSVGGLAADARNVISGNTGDGVYNYGASVYFENNRIGTNFSGTVAIPNTGNGINVEGSALIGSANANGVRNVISGNGGNGIYTHQSVINVRNAYIGTNETGTVDLGNAANGIHLDGASFDDSSKIGGSLANEGNLISGNNQNGIVSAASNTVIQGNRIGTNAPGTAALGNTLDGVHLFFDVQLGGDAAGEGNTVSGNGDDGVKIGGTSSSGVIDVEGNRIGLNHSATAVVPNGGSGVNVSTIDDYGSFYIYKNLIGGNASHGVTLTDSADDVSIYLNYIGTNANNANFGNGGSGVYVFSTATDCSIHQNTIAHNSGDGVYLQPGFGSAFADQIGIRENSIYANSGLGIDLGPTNGVTPNDFGDADNGPNGLQNFPVLQTATTTTVSGTLNSAANSEFQIHFYRADVCDASGYGEGRYYLGEIEVVSDAAGNATFTKNFPLVAGQIVTATATKKVNFNYRNTSEFSQCKTVVQQQQGNLHFGAATFTTNENVSSLILAVNRSGGSEGTVTVNYQTADGTAIAGQDFAATNGTLTFTAGQTVKNITIPITNDPNDEPNQDFTIALSNPTGGANVVNPSSAVVIIVDNDNPPTVSINDVSGAEGNENTTAFTFTVSLSNASAFATAVNWTTANGTANATTDYQTNSGTINFLAGETSKQITVQVIGELLVEINETFNVNLSAPTMATVGDGQGVGTILDDDNPGKFSFSLAPYNAAENAGAQNATVTRTGGSAGTATVDIAIVSGGTATAGQDYTAVSSTLVFLDGETTKNFPITILDDQATEATETINLALSNPTGGATIQAGTATINILDDDNGYESDVAPRPTGSGNGTVTNDDFMQIGNFVAGLDQVNPNYNEFQRADSAPRISLGNGVLDVADLTQAGRYAAGLDAVALSGGQIAPRLLEFDDKGKLTIESLAALRQENPIADDPNIVPTVVRVVNASAAANQQVVVSIVTDATSTENGFGFTLNYDQTKLSNPLVMKGANTQTATLFQNVQQAGKVGVVLAMPFGESIGGGTREVVQVRFNVAPMVQSGLTALTFGDAPVIQAVSDINANTLQSVFQDGGINIVGPTAATVAVGGRVVAANGKPVGQARISMTDASGAVRIAIANPFGYYKFADVPAGETYVFGVSHKLNQFIDASRILTIIEDTEDINFVGEN